MFDYFVLCSEQMVETEYVQGYGILRRCHAVPSGRIATDKAQNSHLYYTPVP